LKDQLDPLVPGLAVFGSEDKPALGIVPVFLTVLPGLGLMTHFVILAEFFLYDFYTV
jgi:hypothetical protein